MGWPRPEGPPSCFARRHPQRPPSLLYFQIELFKNLGDKKLGDKLDEERILKSATGLRNAIVWKKLFRF
ncbi:MAG: hypothetical protein EOQ95_18570 [Mesorhizobium sp.]|nr:MAG: hypothetical protein EOQ95_18570 [Mesorhizobium sp.]